MNALIAKLKDVKLDDKTKGVVGRVVGAWLLWRAVRYVLFTRRVPHKKGAILITGCSSGIGQDAAIVLAKAGYVVFAGCRSDKDMQKLSVLLPKGQAKGYIRPIRVDICNKEQIGSAVAEIETFLQSDEGRSLPGLVGLFNNAGVCTWGPMEVMSDSHMDKLWRVNVLGSIILTQACLPLLRRCGGRVLVNCSVYGECASAGVGAYCITKHATSALGSVLRRELSTQGVFVGMLKPGFVRTAIVDKLFTLPDVEISKDLQDLYGPWLDGRSEQRFDLILNKLAPVPRTSTSRDVRHFFTSYSPQHIYRPGIFSRLFLMIESLPYYISDKAMGVILPSRNFPIGGSLAGFKPS